MLSWPLCPQVIEAVGAGTEGPAGEEAPPPEQLLLVAVATEEGADTSAAEALLAKLRTAAGAEPTAAPGRPQTKGEAGKGGGEQEERLAAQAARIAELEADKLRLEQQLAQLRTAPPRPARPNAQIPFRTSLRGDLTRPHRCAQEPEPEPSAAPPPPVDPPHPQHPQADAEPEDGEGAKVAQVARRQMEELKELLQLSLQQLAPPG